MREEEYDGIDSLAGHSPARLEYDVNTIIL